jgi:hypothetical protein
VLVMAPAGTPSQMTLKGGGTLTLDEYGIDFIDGTGGAVPTTFVNVSNTIAGAGRIGDRGPILKNGGTVNATGGINGSDLVIDTGSRTVTNTGTMTATGGALYIASPLSNTGVLIADAFSLFAAQGSTGGTAKLDDAGQMEFGGPTTTAVKFDDSSASSLVLDDSVHFKGVITGFGKLNLNQSIDLLDIDSTTVVATLRGRLAGPGRGCRRARGSPRRYNCRIARDWRAMPPAGPRSACRRGRRRLLSRWRSQGTGAKSAASSHRRACSRGRHAGCARSGF